MSDTDTVTLGRSDYKALLDRLEDAEDHARLNAIEADEVKSGKGTAQADYLPVELVERLCAGEHPVRVWRHHCGLTRGALAAAAGMAPSYLTEIETRRKLGSFAALAKLAAALGVSLDDIAAWVKEPR